VNLEQEWKAGQEKANQLLTEFFGSSEQVDFSALFSQSGIDHLRPMGSYIGSKVEVGDERSEQELDLSPPSDMPSEVNTDSSDNNSTFDDVPVGMDIEDFLDSENESPKPDPYLTIEGEKYHKPSIVTAKLTSKGAHKVTMCTLRVCGVTINNLHQSDHTMLNAENFTEGYMVKKQDIVGTLV
jgi:hypothetical protein